MATSCTIYAILRVLLCISIIGVSRGISEQASKLWLYESLKSPEEFVYIISKTNRFDNQSNLTEPLNIIQPYPNQPSSNSSACELNCLKSPSDHSNSNSIEPDMSASFLKPSHHMHNTKPKRSRSELSDTKSSLTSAPSIAGIKMPFLKTGDNRMQLKKNVLKFLTSHNRKLSLPVLAQKNHETHQPTTSLESEPSTGSIGQSHSSTNDQSHTIDQFFHSAHNEPSSQPLITFPVPQNHILNPQPQHLPIGGFTIPQTPIYQFNRAIHLANPAQFLGLSPPRIQIVQPPHHPFQITTPLDQNAAQSVESYQRIRFNNNHNSNEISNDSNSNHNNNNNNNNNHNSNDHRNQNPTDFPMFLSNIPQASNSDQARDNQLKSDLKSSIANQMSSASTSSSLNQIIQPVIQPSQFPSPQASSTPQTSAASTAALLSEKARTLLNQMNLNAKANLVNSIFNARPIALNSPSVPKAQIDNPAMSSMIKSAAEAWAASASGADSNPAIIVEHDGPSITTVDFGNNQPPRVNENPPEDEEVSAFYAEENEETESEGSNGAKKVIKLRHNHRHPFEHQVDSQNVQTEAPLDSSFFEGLNNHRTTRMKRPSNLDQSGEAISDYLRYHRLVDRTNSYPDSINAIKQRENHPERHEKHDFVSSVRNKLLSSSDEQIDKLIRELRELNQEKKEKLKVKKVNEDDYDQASSDEEESEQIRLLKKKLMARLKSKIGEEPKKESESKGFSSEAIKIPLHTLLLAALDRRMSSSERNPTVSPDLVADERTRGVLTTIESEFHDMTTGVDLNPLFGSRNTSNSLAPDHLNTPPNLSRPRMAGYEVQIGMNASPPNTSENPLRNIQVYSNIKDQVNLPNTKQSNGQNQPQSSERHREFHHSINQEQDSLYSGTTQMPVVEPPQGGYLATKRSRRSQYRRDRGEADEEKDGGDFDVNRQINNFAHDNNDPNLEPAWMSRGNAIRKHKPNGPENSIEFDDDSNDESRSGNSQKVLKRRRPPPNYVDGGEKNFFDALRTDTTEDPDVDKRISDIGSRTGSREPSHTDGLNSRNDDADFNSDDQVEADNQSSQNDRETPRKSSESRSLSSTWKPHMIDEEVRKIEESSRNVGPRPQESAKHDDDGDYDSDDDQRDRQKHEETSESRHYSTTLQPGNDIKLTFKSSNQPQRRIIPINLNSAGQYVLGLNRN